MINSAEWSPKMPPRPVLRMTLPITWFRTEPQARRMPPPYSASRPMFSMRQSLMRLSVTPPSMRRVAAGEEDGVRAPGLGLEVADGQVMQPQPPRIAAADALLDQRVVPAVERHVGDFHVLAAVEADENARACCPCRPAGSFPARRRGA